MAHIGTGTDNVGTGRDKVGTGTDTIDTGTYKALRHIQADMTKLMVAFRNFANAPETGIFPPVIFN